VSEVKFEDRCKAKKDFEDHKNVKITLRSGGYLLKPVLMAFEKEHKRYYELFLIGMKHYFDESYNNIMVGCEKVNDVETARNIGITNIKNSMQLFMSIVKDAYDIRTNAGVYAHPEDNPWEQEIHKSVYKEIDGYIETLGAVGCQ
jgi:hypothetical protein